MVVNSYLGMGVIFFQLPMVNRPIPIFIQITLIKLYELKTDKKVGGIAEKRKGVSRYGEDIKEGQG